MSEKIKDGGPAFPRPMSHDGDGPRADAFVAQDGMSLRDWFAGQALIGTLAFPIPGAEKIPVNAARECFAYADAMLKAREGQT